MEIIIRIIKAVVFILSLHYSASWVKYVATTLSGKVDTDGNPTHGLIATIGWGLLYSFTN